MAHTPEHQELPQEKSNAQKRCEGKGGTWDATTQTCTLPEATPTPQPTAPLPERTVTSREGVSAVQTPEETRRLQGLGEFTQGLPQELTAAGRIATSEQVAEAEAVIEAERQRLITEETPQRRELTPEISGLEKLPVIGGTFGVIKDRLQEVTLSTIPEGEFKEAFKENLGVATPEELRTLALSQIEKEEIERGLTASEKFGATIEGIPVVGSLASKFAGGLIETPSENAAQVKTDLLKEKRRISNIETNVKLGYLPVSVATEQLTDIENNVQRLESRLKLLINNSPELKFNSDLVNTYETEILLTREKIFQGKLNVLTGASVDPTELQILQQLRLDEEPEA